jgi:hypothetical protein
LRAVLLIYAVVALAGAFVLYRANMGLLVAAYLALQGLVVGVAVIFERGRYQSKVSPGQDWETTHEKFQDPTTGKWMTVRYNKRTGERDYVESKD